jgi:hypothetical protein
VAGNATDIGMHPSRTEGNIHRTGCLEGNGTSRITGIVSRLGDSSYVVLSGCEVKDCISSKRNKIKSKKIYIYSVVHRSDSFYNQVI